MSRLVEAKRTIGLLVLLMAAIVALSGPVAEVLDLPSSVAEAKKKHKHKKKHKKKPQFNVVQCPTSEDTFTCEGTAANDFLVGGPEDRPFGAFDEIRGAEGNDVYNGGNGGDFLQDSGATSSDTYLFPATDFGRVLLDDRSGSADSIDLRSYSIDDFLDVFKVGDTTLFLLGPDNREIAILNFLGEGKIETIRFADGAITGAQAESLAKEATPEEQAALKERLPEDERSVQGVDSQESKRSEQPDAARSPQTK